MEPSALNVLAYFLYYTGYFLYIILKLNII